MKIALYFGSFNPLHKGHVAICNYLLEQTDIDLLRLIVTPGNPLKSEENFKNATERFENVRIAVNNLFPHGRVILSDIEFRLPVPLYTVNTIRVIKKAEPDNHFVIIMGADNLAIIEKWHKWQELLEENEIWIYPRIGSNAQELCKKYGCRYLDAPMINISSTEIRQNRLHQS